jgi:DNA repair protein RadC
MDNNINTAIYEVDEIELIYKSKISPSLKPKVITSKDAYDIFINNWDLNKIELIEKFKILLLNRANRVLGILLVSSGGLTGTVADPRIILCTAIKSASCSIILCHNHPSGSLNPSNTDVALTQKITQACLYIDIVLLDHLIITKEGYFSFADEGLL